MQSLESGGVAVVRGDWRNNITEDLRQGNSPPLMVSMTTLLIFKIILTVDVAIYNEDIPVIISISG